MTIRAAIFFFALPREKRFDDRNMKDSQCESFCEDLSE